MDAWRQRALDAASQLKERATPYVEKAQSAMVSMQQSQSEYIASMREGWEGETVDREKEREKDPEDTVFGIPLSQVPVSLADSHSIPAILHRCVEHIALSGGTDQVGIYRLSGGASAVRAVRCLFTLSRKDPGPIELDTDPNASASALKAFLRELPEPILTRNLNPQFVSAVASNNMNAVQSLIATLPACNQSALRFLLLHLLDVSKNEEVNKMSVDNLALVFSPSLSIQGDVLKFLITNSPSLFNKNISASNTYDAATPAPIARKPAPPPPPPSKRTPSQNSQISNILSNGSASSYSKSSQPPSPSSFSEDKPSLPSRPQSIVHPQASSRPQSIVHQPPVPRTTQTLPRNTGPLDQKNRNSSPAAELLFAEQLDHQLLAGLKLERGGSGASLQMEGDATAGRLSRPVSGAAGGQLASAAGGSLGRRGPPPPPPPSKRLTGGNHLINI
ncbi:hypothetical protein HDU78_001043 [Chytriomyces hyalinus]|nr:hypothetical protein HDU78_001043 [Chytriomyces hyalinus]